jgi:hypothetical protein
MRGDTLKSRPSAGFNPVRLAEFPIRPAARVCARLTKSNAPRKRSMVAWRRRPIPRVMQCPRQGFGLAAADKVQRRRLPFPARFRRLKRGLAGDVSGREDGVVPQIFPVVGDLAA